MNRLPESEVEYRRLLIRSVAAIAACAAAVAMCYLLVDRQVAFFIHGHAINTHDVIKWLTYPPPVAQAWSPLILALLAIRRAFGEWRPWQLSLFLACVSLIVADQFRYSIGEIAGRYWPETWHNNNPSLIGSGTYGFHLFSADDDQGSFPSGHAARIAGFLGVCWVTFPRARWCWAAIAAPMLIALVAMNYHFVSDVLAGTVLGATIAAWTALLAKQH